MDGAFLFRFFFVPLFCFFPRVLCGLRLRRSLQPLQSITMPEALLPVAVISCWFTLPLAYIRRSVCVRVRASGAYDGRGYGFPLMSALNGRESL